MEMKRIKNLLIMSALLAWGNYSLQANEPLQSARVLSAPNAAGIYWHAFAAFPSLDGEEKNLLKVEAPTDKAPLPSEIVTIVARYERALHEMQRASAVVPCDWQLDMAAGPELILPHVDKAVELSRVALLRARQHFAEGETDAALGDLLAVFKLARDCGASPLIVAMYVDAAIEKSATEVLATHLTRLSTSQVRQFTAALRELPQSNDLASTIAQDQRMSCDWLEREINAEVTRLNDSNAGGQAFLTITTPLFFQGGSSPSDEEAAEERRKADLLKTLSLSDIQEALQQVRSNYGAIYKIAELPLAERVERSKSLTTLSASNNKMQTREDAMRYISKIMMPFDWNEVFVRDERMHVRRQLLEYALNVQIDGAYVVQEIHGKKVEYRKIDGGFELRCLVGDKPEVLTVGSRRL
jgi:hypothetical protein